MESIIPKRVILVLSLYCICVVNICAQKIVTSSNSVRRFSKVNLTSNLQKYIDHETLRLKIITNFSGYEDEVPLVEKRLKEFKILHDQLKRNESTADKYRNDILQFHPTTLFTAIRNFMGTFGEKFENQTLYGKRMREFLETSDVKPLPTRDDFHQVGMAFSVLQDVYNISVSDLVKGKVMGHSGAPLTPSDCYDIGQMMLKDGLIEAAKNWTELAVNKTDLAKVKRDDLTFNLSNALATLAKIEYQRKNRDESMQLFEKAIEIDPENEALDQEYVRHRSGRTVIPLEELVVPANDPQRQKFVQQCANSTKVNSYHIPNTTNPRLYCRYRLSRRAPYFLYKEEILSQTPFISVVYQFLFESEIEAVKNATLDKTKSLTLPGHDGHTMWQFKANYMRDIEDPSIADISQKVGDVTKLNVTQNNTSFSLGEPVQIIDYGLGGLTMPHSEHSKIYDSKYMGIANGHSLATVLIYLSDVTLGGATVFTEQNVTVNPQKGMAVLWYNYKPTGEPEENLLVGTCPLAVGENIVLEKGVWWLDNINSEEVCGRKMTSSRSLAEKARDCAKTRLTCSPLVKGKDN